MNILSLLAKAESFCIFFSTNQRFISKALAHCVAANSNASASLPDAFLALEAASKVADRFLLPEFWGFGVDSPELGPGRGVEGSLCRTST